jgi:hypothetical protein
VWRERYQARADHGVTFYDASGRLRHCGEADLFRDGRLVRDILHEELRDSQ